MNIIGHEWAVKRLTRAIERGQLAQSHLFVGPPSIGKATLAREMAVAVLARHAANPQRTRTLIEQNKHPDLSWLAPIDGSIKVEPLRDLMRTLSLSPVESSHRVAVIDDAHLMSDSGKNAILKTLEEPNPKVVLVLIAPSVESVLPTIASRCQVLNLRPLGAGVIEAALIQQGHDPAKARTAAQAARGQVGRALALLNDESQYTAHAQRIADLQRLLTSNRAERLAYAEKLARAEDEDIAVLLDDWALYWRDYAKNAAPDHSQTRAATHAMRAIVTTRKHLAQNVNARLALDMLMLDLSRV